MTRRRIVAALLCCGVAGAVAAQERPEFGRMWTFEAPPLRYLEREYGFVPSADWLRKLQLATLRFERGATASFVSPRGLILTNQHCVRGELAELSATAGDLVRDGFVARAFDEELRLPGVSVQQLVAQQDVTAQIEQGIDEQDAPEVAEKKRRANQQRVLERARAEHPELRAQIVRLHAGAQWQLYLQRSWDDVRLVMAPHLQAAYFGGDSDNFTYPRWSLDFAFCRAYEDGKPADTSAHWLRLAGDGAADGDPVFVAGHPASTDRLQTVAQLEYLRDAHYPLVREALDSRVEIVLEQVAAGGESARGLSSLLFSFQNLQKAYAGYHAGLLNEELFARKRALEAELRARVRSDPRAGRRCGDVWDRLASIARRQAELEPALRFHSPAGSPQLGAALALVRAVDPQVPDEDRGRLRKIALRELRASAVDELFLADHLARAQRWLPAADPFLRAALDGGTAATAARRLLGTSRIGDVAFRRELLEGGSKAVARSADPLIAVARVLAPLFEQSRRMRERLETEAEPLHRELALATFGSFGSECSPDGTGTLRFSDGRVRGLPQGGTVAPSRTTFYGLFARHSEFDGRPPFDLPDLFLQRRDRLDLSCPLDFASTNDITAGNSGSPVVDRHLQLVGVVFDSNLAMLPNRFVHSDTTARTVSVHVRAILEVLTHVYSADALLRELRGV